MTVYLTTDTHFGHAKKLTQPAYGGRPQDYEAKLYEGFSTLRKGDTLIHLGDICIGNDLDIHKNILLFVPADVRLILIKGNHDNKSNTWYLRSAWDFVAEEITDTYYGKRILFSHRPQPKREGVDLNIHGHWHGNDHRSMEAADFYDTEYHKQLALELHGYQPVAIKKFLGA